MNKVYSVFSINPDGKISLCSLFNNSIKVGDYELCMSVATHLNASWGTKVYEYFIVDMTGIYVKS